MLDLFSSGIVSLWLDMAGVGSAAPNAASVLAWRGGIPGLVVAEDLAFGGIDAANPDLPAAATVREYLKELKDKNLIDGNQGIWVQAGMVPLVSQQGTVLMPGASLTKIATSLASLETWGADYQFETRFRGTGRLAMVYCREIWWSAAGAIRCLCGRRRSPWAMLSIKWV